MISSPKDLKVLFFDVFGTCVAQRVPVTNELRDAAKAALEQRDSSISPDVRKKAEAMTQEHWREVMESWNRDEGVFVKSNIAAHGRVPWDQVDSVRLRSLHRLLATRGLVISASGGASEALPSVAEGSLFTDAQMQYLNLIWHRLPPWPDVIPGLTLFSKHVPTVTLSNTHSSIIAELVAHSSIPFSKVWSADMFQSYKPNPTVYLSAARDMGVEPHQCGLLATHLYDLEAAKKCGFWTCYVERPEEESHPELVGKGIEDWWIRPAENGFVTVAERLGWATGE